MDWIKRGGREERGEKKRKREGESETTWLGYLVGCSATAITILSNVPKYFIAHQSIMSTYVGQVFVYNFNTHT
ncbi:hypothetical protein F4775DRAFT_559714 [Biscogniauxia sp. FL1348]|nr:hypothetical protein F4775DRAFT_559714 [Biscogniauxia sp. FL1348]